MLTLQKFEATTGHPTGRENDGGDDYSLVYAPTAFEKPQPADHALRVWISEDGGEYHLWISEYFDGDRKGIDQYFIRGDFASPEDGLVAMHEDIERYLSVLG
jgi:hypothetical protein